MTVELDKEDFISTYDAASSRFRVAYKSYSKYRELVISETRIMFNALKDAGYTNKAAINKIAEDHKDLKGFSQKSIYRNLPDDIKDQSKRNNRLGYHDEPNSVVKNTEFDNRTSQNSVVKNGEFDNKTLAMPEVRTVKGVLNEGPDEDDTEEYNEELSPKAQKLQDTVIGKIDALYKENSELRQENKFLKDSIAFFKDTNNSLRKKLEEYQKIPPNDALINQIDLLKKENAQLREQLGNKGTESISTTNAHATKDAPAQDKDWLLGK